MLGDFPQPGQIILEMEGILSERKGKRRVNLEKNEIQLAESYTRRRWLPS